MLPRTSRTLACFALGLVFSGQVFAQDGGAGAPPPGGSAPGAPAPAPGTATPTAPGPATNPSKAPENVPPAIAGARGGVDINYVDADLMSLVEYFARVTGRNFILQDTKDLANKKVTIISNSKVSPEAAYEAFLSALEVHGLTTVQVGGVYKIIKSSDAQQSPGRINEGGDILPTDNYITQIITLQNVSVTDIRTIIDNLISPNAKVLAYAPTNSLILTDSGNNIRRIYKLVTELDVAAPKSTMEIYQVVYADAAELKDLIEQLYGTAEDSSSSSSSAARGAKTPARTPAARARRDEATAAPTTQEGVTAGKESRYITKVLSDDRTNTLIVLANEQGHDSVKELIKKVDVDVDPTSRSQIYVYRLEHAKAEDISKVLSDLAQDKSKAGGAKGDLTNPNARVSAARAKETTGSDASSGDSSGEKQGAAAAFDSGMRIAADENTNSLVIIASKDDYAVIESVIRQLDTRRKQVYLDCVIVELTSQDNTTFDIAYHTPFSAGGETTGLVAGQFGASSLGLSTDALNGFSFGVFGKSFEIPIIDPTTGLSTTISVPSFGIALQALKTNQMVNIVSSPSLLAMDNEKAKIVVGRKIPFPTSNGLSSLGQPVISYQRQDVAITMEVTPRVNSENYVTLELKVEVQEVEENQSASAATGGPTTSNRSIETVALVADNQTMVLGGLVGSTNSESESKIPILGDLPLIGALFRNSSKTIRRTNLMVFLTPHIIDDEEDMAEVMRVKEAQRQEFMRRFYGKNEDEQMQELQRLLQFSMNRVDRPSVFRGPASVSSTVTLDGEPISAEAREDVTIESQGARTLIPGEGAGQLPPGEVNVDIPDAVPAPAPAPTPGPEGN